MLGPRSESPRVSALADRLIADIKRRKLAAGDRYLTTLEASKMLGVGNGMANRALQILERRKIIVRQQRKGAFLSEPPSDETSLALGRVHFLVHKRYLRTEGVGQDEMLLGIEHQLPAVPVQISFLPAADEASFVNELIDESLKTQRTDGFVLMRASYETQLAFSQTSLPAVVFGTVYPSVEQLPALTLDMKQAGYLLAKHLLEKGHKRLAYFNRQLVYGGDHLTMEGIAVALQEAGRGLDALTSRFIPTYREAYVATAEKLLAKPDRPTGFVCRTVLMADAVAKAAQSSGLIPGKDVEIVVCDCYLKPREKAKYVWPKPGITGEELGRNLARLLIVQVDEGDKPVRREVMPVALECPKRVIDHARHTAHAEPCNGDKCFSQL